MKISAHILCHHGEGFNHPYLQAIESLLWCDELIVGCDPRFDDGTVEHLKKITSLHANVTAVIEEFDFDHPNPHGYCRQVLRENCSGDWILSIEPDQTFRKEYIEIFKSALNNLPMRILLCGVPCHYFFNGRWIHRGMPKVYPIVTRNTDKIRHSLDAPNHHGLFGAAYIDHGGIKVPVSMIIPTPCYSFEWYSLPRRWEQKQYWHYIEGRLKGVYSGLADYKKNLDLEEVSFWGVTGILPLEEYHAAIRSEMYPRRGDGNGMPRNSLKRFRGKIPVIMAEWCNSQRVLPIRRWLLWASRGMKY